MSIFSYGTPTYDTCFCVSLLESTMCFHGDEPDCDEKCVILRSCMDSFPLGPLRSPRGYFEILEHALVGMQVTTPERIVTIGASFATWIVMHAQRVNNITRFDSLIEQAALVSSVALAMTFVQISPSFWRNSIGIEDI